MIKPGIFTKTYAGTDLKETFSRMKGHGLSHTQLNLSSAGLPSLPNSIEEKQLEEILSLAKEYGIIMDALSGTFNMIDPDEDRRQKGCEQFRLQCEIASILQIPIITLCTGSRNRNSQWEWHDDNLTQDSWDTLMRSTDVIIQLAEAHHITLGVETEASNIINTPTQARRYLDCVGSPNLKIIMDGANLFLPHQIPQMKATLDKAFALLGKDIVLAHAKDLALKDDNIVFVAAGEGCLNFPYYVQLLKQYQYSGGLIMHGLSEAQTPGSCQFLKEVLANA